MAGVARSWEVRSVILDGFASKASILAAELSKLNGISSDSNYMHGSTYLEISCTSDALCNARSNAVKDSSMSIAEAHTKKQTTRPRI